MQLCWQYSIISKDGPWKTSCYSSWGSSLCSGHYTKLRSTHVSLAHYNIFPAQRYGHSSLEVLEVTRILTWIGRLSFYWVWLNPIQTACRPSLSKVNGWDPQLWPHSLPRILQLQQHPLNKPTGALRSPSEEALQFWKACWWACFHAMYS